MKIIKTLRAVPASEIEIDSLTLVFEQEPKQEDLAKAREEYLTHAEKIVTALVAHAPGGLVDAILYTLLKEKASLFRVAFKDK
jgi:hypothetical protein